MRLAEILMSAFFIIIAGAAIFDANRLGFGYTAWGPEPGFLPFGLAAIMLIMALVILWQGQRMKKAGSFFMSKEAMISTGYVALTSAIYTAMIAFLGVYIAIFLYSLLFTSWLGKCRWYSVIGLTVILTLAIYFGFEWGLKLPLPKSPWYITGLLPF